jgi:catechol 2,3-dioxygenase-like lactoylglutathione lyase family enzyme
MVAHGSGSGLRRSALIATIPVRDLERARRFYVDVLRLDFERESDAGVLLRAGDARVLLYRSASPAPQHTLVGFEVERLEPVMAELAANGVQFEDYDFPGLQTVNHIAWIGPERAAWLRDSESNILSISEAWLPDRDAATEHDP